MIKNKPIESDLIGLHWFRSVDRVLNNDTSEVEAMLITQAKSLEYLFYDALTKLPNSSMEHAEVFANIALKAQSGCRKTLMAIAELKQPRRTTTIIKQQNEQWGQTRLIN